jgi:hypothetical protein
MDDRHERDQGRPDRPDPSQGPDANLRTGAEQEWDPEDLAVAQGHDPTPEQVDRARQQLEEEGPAAIEKTVP